VRTSDHLPSHHLEESNFKPPSTTPLTPSPPPSNSLPSSNSHHHHVKKYPPSEAPLPAVGDSPTCSHSSSLISGAAVADVELTISPDAADVAVVAAVSKVRLSFYFHIII